MSELLLLPLLLPPPLLLLSVHSGVAGPLAAWCGGQICRPIVLGFGQEGQNPLTGERAANFRLLANQ